MDEEKPKEEELKSRIIINFADEGSANFTFSMEGLIYPNQFYAIAGYFRMMADSAIAQQEMMRMQQAQQQQIAQPEKKLIIPETMMKKKLQ